MKALTMVALALLAPSTAQAAELGDPVRLPVISAPVTESSSGPGASTALVGEGANSTYVSYQDAHGRWHRFAGPTGDPRLAPLGDGGGVAAWGDSFQRTVSVRVWHSDGRLDPPAVVLTGVQTTQDSVKPAWQLSAEPGGTVVIAAANDHGAVSATIRDPGGAFGPQQELLAAAPAPSPVPAVRISPIAADGTVSVTWRDERRGSLTINDSGVATRPGRSPGFGPASAYTPPAADPAVLVADDSQVVRVAPDVGTYCANGCFAKRFSWSDGTQRLAFAREVGSSPISWYVAQPGSDGTFGTPELATRSASGPVWTTRPGVIAFERVAEDDWEGRGGGLYQFTYGEPARLAPRFEVERAYSLGRVLNLEGRCRSACTIGASTRAVRAQRAFAETVRLTYSPAPLQGAAEPLERLQLQSGFPAKAHTLRVAMTIRDAYGRHTREVVTLRRGAGDESEYAWRVSVR